jgi:general secretion pathway protein B
MSLILDALRKSEAERQRGKAPGLFVTVPMTPPPRRGDWIRLWPWLGLSALLLAVVLYFLLRSNGPASTDDEQNALVPSSATVSQSESTQAAVARANASATNVGTGPQPAAPGATPAPIRPPASNAAATSATSRPTIAPPSLAQQNANAQAPVPPASPSNPPAPAANTTPAAPADQDNDEALPPIAILDASERASLPPLKLSMHVYAQEPAKRFAIIDGQRVTEGSSIGASVVEQIRRDGVVLNINGRRILIPRP